MINATQSKDINTLMSLFDPSAEYVGIDSGDNSYVQDLNMTQYKAQEEQFFKSIQLSVVGLVNVDVCGPFVMARYINVAQGNPGVSDGITQGLLVLGLDEGTYKINGMLNAFVYADDKGPRLH
jgi:hypothetical protein